MAKDTSKLRRKAAEQLRKGSRDKALALLKEACDKDQYDPENWLQLAELQLQQGDAAGASDSMFRTTDIYARCGMVKEAFAACCRTLDLAPTHGPARRMGRFLVSRLPDAEQDAADAMLDQAGKPKAAAPTPAPAAPAAEAAPPAPAAAAAPTPPPEPAAPAAPGAPEPVAESAAPEPVEPAPTEEEERTIDRGSRPVGAAAPTEAGPEPGPEPGEDERTIERGAVRRLAEGEEEVEEKTIERGAVSRPAAEGGGGEGVETPSEASAEATPETIPEEGAESAATSPWWTGTRQPPPLAPPEGAPEPAEDDVTMPVWPPRAVLPPPPVEILTLEIEAELPDDGRPQAPVRGEIDAPAAPAAPASTPHDDGMRPTALGPRLGGEGSGVPEPIAPTFSGPAELPPEVPLPAEPALDALSLRDLLGVAEGSADGLVEILVDPPAAAGASAPAEPGAAAALRSPLLGDLDPTLLKRLVDGAELQRRRRGEVVMRQGTFGTALYVILRGEVAVVRENPPPPLTLAKLRTGAFFGEMSLITNFPRSATVVAESDLDLLVVPRKQVSELCTADAQVLRTLLRFCRGRMVATMMAVSPIFQPLGPEVRRALLQHFRLREFDAGAEVVTEGKESGGLHIVMAGRLRVARQGEGEAAAVLAALGPGDVFGEMSLLSKGPAMASITAETRVWVLVLPTLEFESAISHDHPELVAYLGAVADDRRRQNQQAAGGIRSYRDGRIETP